MKNFKQLIVEIADRYPKRGQEFDHYINAMFGERGDVQRLWTTKPPKLKKPSKPKFKTLEQKFEYLKRKIQNKKIIPFTNDSHLSWLKDKIGDHLPYTYGIPRSKNMLSINLPVRNVRDRGENFIIDLEADSYIKELDKHNISYVEGLIHHPSMPHDELGKHLTTIGAIHNGKVVRINMDHGYLDLDPTLSIYIPKQHILDAYHRRSP